MPKNEALQDLKNELHVSHSQIFTYLNCSLKYRFMYVEARPQERVSIALPFGSANRRNGTRPAMNSPTMFMTCSGWQTRSVSNW